MRIPGKPLPLCRFNSQPLEGGCPPKSSRLLTTAWFQLTAARRRLRRRTHRRPRQRLVSTHSRSKAAANGAGFPLSRQVVSTHNRSKAAAASARMASFISPFQLTAARRRLRPTALFEAAEILVSTHSRSKAAADRCVGYGWLARVSTHSRSKAAAISTACFLRLNFMFQLTAARRRLRPRCYRLG